MASNGKYGWAITPDKNKHQYVIGIDLGHGETSAAFCPIGWGQEVGTLEPVKDLEIGNNSKVIPSAISITNKDEVYIGESALEPEILNRATVNVCFKRKPVSIDGEAEQLMMRFMKAVYTLICEKNSALFTKGNHLVYIATPSGWDKDTQNLYGEMATKAGLPMAGVTSESRAAFIKAQKDATSGLPQYINQGAIVFDMGSSTLDFTFLQNNVPTDYGYDCGASRIEKLIYSEIREKNEDIQPFEERYPNLVDKLLFEARCAKEKVYFQPDIRCKKTINFEDLVNDEEFEDAKMKFVFQPGELNELLERKGYIAEIRNSMIDFKNGHIGGQAIHAAFLTGGASRMDFIKPLVRECWGLPEERIYRDQDPSLTISRGVAEQARSDIRSGGFDAQKIMIEINQLSNVYHPFAKALTEKVTDEMTETIAACVTNFRDADNDCSINDLQAYIGENIESDVEHIGEWALECYKSVFEEKAEEIQAKLKKMVSEYTQEDIRMGSTNLSIGSMPEIDMSMLSGQMQSISQNFVSESSNLVTGIAGAAIGGAVAILLGGPLAWLIGGGALLGRWLFGEEKTEEQKRQEALAKDLDGSQRQQVFQEFANNWDDICAKVRKSVENSIYGNQALKRNIESQNHILMDYAKECIARTRQMVEM